ncbi:hypothetical protein LJR220_002679 [Bradyrhizobium sp. LjRoot220]|uniref:hypothetical protein n=1 Tax=Bradyrhizobium sp. LjRoot220 TaxID=3342284 RepID=UPI003ECE32FC
MTAGNERVHDGARVSWNLYVTLPSTMPKRQSPRATLVVTWRLSPRLLALT